VFVSGVRKTHRFPDWFREKSASNLVAQMKGEILKLVPETAEGYMAAISALRFLDVRL
jgi:hypothetical protein